MEILSNLSWSDYLTWAGIVLVCYYTTVALLYYRSDINNLLAGSRKEFSAEVQPQAATDISGLSIAVLNEIDSILEKAGKEAGRSELLQQLRQVLASYPGLQVPAYRNAVFAYVIKKAQQICGMGISVDDLAG